MNTLRCAKTSDISGAVSPSANDVPARVRQRDGVVALDASRSTMPSRTISEASYWSRFHAAHAPITESYLTKRATLSVASDNLRECG